MVDVEPSDLYGLDSIPRSTIEEGERYVFDWSPYTWARDNEGHEGPVVVTIEDVSNLLGDIEMRTDDGKYLNNLGEGRAQVMGRADNTDGVPDVTDVGRGGRYYPYPPQEG